MPPPTAHAMPPAMAMAGRPRCGIGPSPPLALALCSAPFFFFCALGHADQKNCRTGRWARWMRWGRPMARLKNNKKKTNTCLVLLAYTSCVVFIPYFLCRKRNGYPAADRDGISVAAVRGGRLKDGGAADGKKRVWAGVREADGWLGFVLDILMLLFGAKKKTAVHRLTETQKKTEPVNRYTALRQMHFCCKETKQKQKKKKSRRAGAPVKICLYAKKKKTKRIVLFSPINSLTRQAASV